MTLSFQARGQDVSNKRALEDETSFVQKIETARNASTNPIEMYEFATDFLKQSQKQNWAVAALYAESFRIEALVFQERFKEASDAYNLIKNSPLFSSQPTLIARQAVTLLKLNFTSGKLDQIETDYEIAIRSALDTQDDRIIGEAYLAIGTLRVNQQQISEGIKSLESAFVHFENIENNYLLAVALTSLANAYSDINDYELAIKNHQQSLAFYEKTNNLFAQSVAIYNIARAYQEQNVFDKALLHFEMAKNMSIDIGDNLGVALADLHRANVYLDLEDWERALSIFDDVAVKFKEAGDSWSEFFAIAGLIKAHLGLQNAEAAKSRYPTLLSLVGELDGDDVKSTHASIAIAFALENEDFVEAYKYSEIRREYDIKLINQKFGKEALRYKVEFETELANRKSELLEQDNALKNLKILQQEKNEKAWRIVAILTGILFVVMIFTLFLQIRNREEYKKLAMMDVLTSSPNRRSILEFAEASYEYSMNTGSPFCIALIDIDFFKRINDKFGHQVGDNVLKVFANAIKTNVRPTDQFGRYGGEEWLLVLNELQADQSKNIFDRIKQTLVGEQINGLVDGNEVTFSMGVAQFNKETDQSLEDIISRADQRLYDAKSQGRDRVVFETPTPIEAL